MPYSLTAKLLIPICILCTVLAGCGGSSDETSTPASASAGETAEEQTTPVEADDAPSDESTDSGRDALIALVESIQNSESDDGVPLAFNECWIDETLEINGFSAAELIVILETGDNDQVLDTHMGDVVQTCIGQLSAEDFAAVLASGILDDDEPDEEADGENDFREDQVFPDVDAPDLVSDPMLAEEGIEIVVSPGFTNGYLWSGTIKGSGMPPGIVTAIFGCAGSFEAVISNIFETCDFAQPLIALIDDQGNFVATVDDPVPTSPQGTCLLVTTDPDENPDTDDGPGAIVCSENTQVLADEGTPDISSSPLYADPGVEITVSPGIVDGSLWQGVIRGSGFTPGELVGGVGCAATYETFEELFPSACDLANPFFLGIVDENGKFESALLPPTPTVPSGTCLLVGTDPDGNIDTEDGQGALICTR